MEFQRPHITNRTRKILSTVFKIILSGLAIYLLWKKVDIPLVLNYLKDASILYFVLAFFSFLISKLISAIRLNQYYKTQDIHIDNLTNAKIYYNAMFYNIIVPLVGGEAFKVLWIKNHYEAKTKSLIWSALLDRGGGLVALIALSILCFYFIDIHIPFKPWIFIGIAAAYLGSYFLHRWFFSSYKPAFLPVNILSVLVQLLQVVTVYFVILALNIDEQIVEYIFIFLLSSFAYMLPFLGARELAFVYGAEYIGLNEEVSLSISLLFYIVIALNSLLGAIFFVIPIKRKENVKH